MLERNNRPQIRQPPAKKRQITVPPIQSTCPLCGAFVVLDDARCIFGPAHPLAACPMSTDPMQVVSALQKINTDLTRFTFDAIVANSDLLRLSVRKSLLELFLHSIGTRIVFDGAKIVEFQLPNKSTIAPTMESMLHSSLRRRTRHDSTVSNASLSNPTSSFLDTSNNPSPARDVISLAFPENSIDSNAASIDNFMANIDAASISTATPAAGVDWNDWINGDSGASSTTHESPRLSVSHNDPTLLKGIDNNSQSILQIFQDDSLDNLESRRAPVALRTRARRPISESLDDLSNYLEDWEEPDAGLGTDYVRFIKSLQNNSVTLDDEDEDTPQDDTLPVVEEDPEPLEEFWDNEEGNISQDELESLFAANEFDDTLITYEYPHTVEIVHSDDSPLFSDAILNLLKRQFKQSFQIAIQNYALAREFGPSLKNPNPSKYWSECLFAMSRLYEENPNFYCDFVPDAKLIPLVLDNAARLPVSHAYADVVRRHSKRRVLTPVPLPDSVELILKRFKSSLEPALEISLMPKMSKSRRFSPSEDTLFLMGLYEFFDNDWESIQKAVLPNRSAKSLIGRYRYLSRRNSTDTRFQDYHIIAHRPMTRAHVDALAEGLKKYGENFHRIAREYVPSKTPGLLRLIAEFLNRDLAPHFRRRRVKPFQYKARQLLVGLTWGDHHDNYEGTDDDGPEDEAEESEAASAVE